MIKDEFSSLSNLATNCKKISIKIIIQNSYECSFYHFLQKTSKNKNKKVTKVKIIKNIFNCKNGLNK